MLSMPSFRAGDDILSLTSKLSSYSRVVPSSRELYRSSSPLFPPFAVALVRTQAWLRMIMQPHLWCARKREPWLRMIMQPHLCPASGAGRAGT